MWVVCSCGARERSARRSARARALCTPLGQPALQNSPHTTASFSMNTDFWKSSDGSSGSCLQDVLHTTWAAWHLPENSDLVVKVKSLVLQVDVGPGRVAAGAGGGPSLEARGTASRTCTDDIHLDRDLRHALACGEWWADLQNLRAKCSTQQAGPRGARTRQAPRYGASRRHTKHAVCEIQGSQRERERVCV